MSNKTGGPAFPVKDECEQNGQYYGMTLRDYAAIKAMAAMIGTATGPCLGGLDGYEQYTAKAAYKMADAMLSERNKGE